MAFTDYRPQPKPMRVDVVNCNKLVEIVDEFLSELSLTERLGMLRHAEEVEAAPGDHKPWMTNLLTDYLNSGGDAA